ncbi:hypothetical protein GWI33_019546 [Rhynchophorus ferrugineus]|uniref:Uncharacterized protein n=1 Tax=Rhynchophorus ferrugineus TaxID=354439 RepID=A0A834HUB5_RHYFE|nr:hypothetical protein GWI33_019546 [Rhynchophorus ferrugineus]
MMRLLRRSKSAAAAHTEKSGSKTPPGHPHAHHYHHNHVVHPQHAHKNGAGGGGVGGGMVVNMVEGLPFVVGGGKSKKIRARKSARPPPETMPREGEKARRRWGVMVSFDFGQIEIGN